METNKITDQTETKINNKTKLYIKKNENELYIHTFFIK